MEKEKNKEKFSKYFEIDGTIDLYIEIIVQFGLLINFGLAFPLVYTIALFTNIIDI